jgi:cytochrome c biogenesis protein CcdA
MQNQQEKGSMNRLSNRGSHRHVIQLIAGWVLVLWGVFSCLLASYKEEDTFTQAFDLYYVRGIATVLYAICCLASGFTTFLRLSKLTRVLLIVAASCVLIIAGVNIPIELSIRPDIKQAVLVGWTLDYVAGAAVLFALGYWLGRMEEISSRQ